MVLPKLEMGPDPTLNSRPAVNKRPSHFWPGYYLTWSDDIFSYPEGEKMKNLVFLRGNFPNPEVAATQPKPSNKKWPNLAGSLTTLSPLRISLWLFWCDINITFPHYLFLSIFKLKIFLYENLLLIWWTIKWQFHFLSFSNRK